MKITQVDTIVVNMPMRIGNATPMMSGKPRTSIDTLLVRGDTDGDITGWGEAFGHRPLSRWSPPRGGPAHRLVPVH